MESLYGTRRGVQLNNCTVLNVQVPRNPPKLTRSISLPRSIAQPSKINFTSYNLMLEILPVSTLCGYRQKIHGARSGSVAESTEQKHIVGELDDNGLQKELWTWKHFVFDFHLEEGRHSFNNANDFLNPNFLIESWI